MKKEAFWEEQYRRHIGKMVGACYRYVADWDLAEDLAQDAFLAAMEKASTFRAFGSFEGWLKKIAETLGISVANSNVLLTRARAELQQRLKVVARKKLAVSS